jgi:D-alanyl-D-alanine carboxypeptidase (penicillin-binding protein 5/6)
MTMIAMSSVRAPMRVSSKRLSLAAAFVLLKLTGCLEPSLSEPNESVKAPVLVNEDGTVPCGRDGACNSGACSNDPDCTDPLQLPAVSGGSAIVVERSTGRVLGVKNPDTKRAPASTTKIMTGLLAVEAVEAGTLSLNDIVTIQGDVGVEGGGEIGLRPLETISLRDLLHMALISSENDAAVAVGTYVAGSRSAFVARMNARAAQLGLTNTSYVDISGRDPEDIIPGCSGNEFSNPACAHFTTARDLAALSRVALREPIFARIVAKTTHTTTTWRRPPVVPGRPTAVLDVTLTTTNRLLQSSRAEFYAGAYGLKTGTSDRAGSNLVSAATRGNADVVAVVLGAPDDGTPTGDRFTDSRALLDFGL